MVDKTMMGDKCAELVRAAMIGALAVTLGNPTRLCSRRGNGRSGTDWN